MNGPLKIQRTALLHLLAQIYRIAFRYAPFNLCEEEAKQLKQAKEILKHEGFL